MHPRSSFLGVGLADMLTTILLFFLIAATHVLEDHLSPTFFHDTFSSLIETCRSHGLTLDGELVLVILNLATAGTRLELSLACSIHTLLPGGSVLLVLTLLMLCQTHVHVLAVRRAVFGDGDAEPDDDQEDFNPFEYEYGDIHVDLSDSDEEENDSEDEDVEDEEEEPEDGQGEDIFHDEIGMNGSFLSVLIAIAMVSLVIQNIYSEKANTNKNVTTEAT